MSRADFLVEIGTEELPPTALRTLMDAFAAALTAAVDEARLEHGDVHAYASPRRLAVLIDSLANGQPDRKFEQKGPPVGIAFDDDGKPRPPALAFAKKCGVDVSELERTKSDKGEWLSYQMLERGRSAAEVLPALVQQSLDALPIPRRMRWGSNDDEFVRPVHWLLMLHGRDVVDADLFGVHSGNETHGHRFHCDAPLTIREPADYLQVLERDGHVVADFDERRRRIAGGVTSAAEQAGGHALTNEALLDEVTALVEWPVAVLGTFDPVFLELPREVVESTLTAHQRYFPVADASGALLPKFITIANLESRDPDKVREGNERVILPRLADARFFWNSDRQKSLSEREPALADVIYQQGLGSLHDKAARTAGLATVIASMLGKPAEQIERAAMLCKCDLLTGMVGEFPELQGVMGQYYAEADGEPTAVVDAIGEHYRPRFAGDELPQTLAGQILAMADRLDTLAGIFAIGKKPSGNRDPFGLRRAALGVIRLSVECGLDVDLDALVDQAVAAQPAPDGDAVTLATDLRAFISDRLRRYFLDSDPGLDTETFDAVLAREPSSLVDFANRLSAVQSFLELDEAQSLASANKRIANILRKAGEHDVADVDRKLLVDAAEKDLYHELNESAKNVLPLLDDRRYTEALRSLARLKPAVDRFFDQVMVMSDDDAIKNNRLALLHEVRSLFLGVADISRLAIA